MDIGTILSEFASQGLMGVVAILAIIIAVRKDKQVSALYDRLEQKSEKAADKYHTLANEMNDTLRALTDAIEPE